MILMNLDQRESKILVVASSRQPGQPLMRMASASGSDPRGSRRCSSRLESAAAQLALLRRGDGSLSQLGGAGTAEDAQQFGGDSQRRDRCVLDPDSALCKCWYFVLLCAIVWSTFAVPYQISFAPPTLGVGRTWWSLLVADVVLGLDIAVSLNRGFYNEELAYKVVERRLIQRRYIMNVRDFSHPSLARDVLSLVPLNLLEGQLGGLRGVMRLPRLLRTPRIFSLLREIGDKPLGQNTVRVTQVGIIAIMMAHLVACIWYAFGLIDGFGANAWLPGDHLAPDVKEPGLRYLACLYHGLGMMVGVVDGGDPESAAQNIFHVSIMIAALLLFAYSIGVVSAGTEDKNQRALQFESRLKYVQLVLRSHQLPAPLVARVMGFLSYQNHHQDDFDLRIVDELPENLQADLMGRIVRRCVARLPLFRKVAEEEGLLATLATRFEHCVFMPREVMICRGVFIDRLFVLVRGEALQVGGRLRSQWDAATQAQLPRAFARPSKERLQAGDMCGEEMLTGDAPLNTVVAITSIECFALRRQAMQTVLRYFPQAQAQFPHLAGLNGGGAGGGASVSSLASSCGQSPHMLRPSSTHETPRPGSSGGGAAAAAAVEGEGTCAHDGGKGRGRGRDSGEGGSEGAGGGKRTAKPRGRRPSCREMAAATVAAAAHAAASTAIRGAMIGAGAVAPGGDGLEDDEDFLAGVHRARCVSEGGAGEANGAERGSQNSSQNCSQIGSNTTSQARASHERQMRCCDATPTTLSPHPALAALITNSAPRPWHGGTRCPPRTFPPLAHDHLVW